jgi:hypothetical protein
MNIKLNDSELSPKLLIDNSKTILINNINTTNTIPCAINSTTSLLSNNIAINGDSTTSTPGSIGTATTPATGYYIIQSSASSNPASNMMQIKPQQSHQIQHQPQTFQFITNQYQNQPQQVLNQNNVQNSQTKYIAASSSNQLQTSTYAFGSNSSNLASPRLIIQSSNNNNSTQNIQQINYNQQSNQPTFILQNSNQVQNSQSNSNSGASGQIFLNINNRIVPIQSLNIKNATTSTIGPAILNTSSLQPQQTQSVQRVQFITTNNAQLSQQNISQQNNLYSSTNQSATSETIISTSNNNSSSNLTSSTGTTTSLQNQQYLIISNNNQNNTPTVQTQQHNSISLGADITDKMKQLEQIQNQLKAFQLKLTSSTEIDSSNSTTTFTQQQIQSILTQSEQIQLQKLIVQRKNVQNEIQQLQQKLLLTPSVSVTDSPNNTATTTSSNKMQLLQQVTAKINSIKSNKSVINSSNPNEQQLVMTQEEFEQMKKLIDLQSQLQNELNSNNHNNMQQQNVQQSTTIKLSELSLADKNKLNDLIKTQIQQLKQSLTTNFTNLNQQAMKEKLVTLIKKQSEIQLLIDQTPVSNLTDQQNVTNNLLNITKSAPNIPNNQSNNTGNTSSANKQTPIKIRNFISSNTSQSNLNNDKIINNNTSSTTPLRTLVINNNIAPINTSTNNNLNKIGPQLTVSNLINNSSSNNKPLNVATSLSNVQGATSSPHSITQELISLESATNLQKQYFPHVKFKCLNFIELAQHSIITKQTSEFTINLIKQLDDRASTVINPDQVESFTKNQVKLVKKYLDQQQTFKLAIKNRIQDQLSKDQRLVIESDYKTPFVDKTDAIKRLSRYHVLQKTFFEPNEEDCLKFDESFEQVSERLLKKADAMKKRFHLFQLRTMQKEVISSEETLLLKLFVDDLKQNFEIEKKDYSRIDNNESSIISSASMLSPTSIRKFIQNNNSNNDTYNYNNISLKRSFKSDETLENEESDTQQIKQTHLDDFKPDIKPIIDQDLSSNLNFNSESYIKNFKKVVSIENENKINDNENNQMNTNHTESKFKMNLFINEVPIKYDETSSSVSSMCISNDLISLNNQNSNFISTIPNNEFEDDHLNNSSSINNLSGLDELILNEEDLGAHLDF